MVVLLGLRESRKEIWDACKVNSDSASATLCNKMTKLGVLLPVLEMCTKKP